MILYIIVYSGKRRQGASNMHFTSIFSWGCRKEARKGNAITVFFYITDPLFHGEGHSMLFNAIYKSNHVEVLF